MTPSGELERARGRRDDGDRVDLGRPEGLGEGPQDRGEVGQSRVERDDDPVARHHRPEQGGKSLGASTRPQGHGPDVGPRSRSGPDRMADHPVVGDLEIEVLILDN